MAEITHPTSQTLRQHPHARPLKLGAALKNVLAVIFGLALAIAALDFGYWALDPNGTRAVTEFQDWLKQTRLPDETGYTLPDGTHELGRYTFTFQNGTRLVPDTNASAPRKLILIGDSVTFGMGVSDDEAFANQLARAMPDWNVINAGLPAYNIGNIERVAERYAGADCRIYIAVMNDHEADVTARNPAPRGYEPQLKSELYYFFAMRRAGGETDYTDYVQRAAALRDSGVVVVAARGAPLENALFEAGVPVEIPRTRGYIANHDRHPNAESHQQIAAALLPIIRRACE